ncbi:hypothetical protein [Natrinema sp. SYSU A 869]|uniref:hypothetical protein n=1 Tax=Natrinema sp. SYSU A 869 TaxID=2871694 RepID=UPI001CA46235|nr:hypothetical protein [Natrinema sp. SYSU A 869]
MDIADIIELLEPGAGVTVGALVAGITGIVTQEYITTVKHHYAKRAWYDRLGRLANRLIIEVPTDDKLKQRCGEDISKIDDHSRRYLEIYPLLEDHIADAPDDCPTAVFDALELLFDHRKEYHPDAEIINSPVAARRDASGVVSAAKKLDEVANENPRPTLIIQFRDKLSNLAQRPWRR